jgi:hypothetical protein
MDTFIHGWIEDPDAVTEVLMTLEHPTFASAAPDLAGGGEGKTVLLWKTLEQVTGRPYEFDRQTIGDCVSHGNGLASDLIESAQIVLENSGETWSGRAATEVIYGGSRVEIGGGRVWGDGSVGAWAAKWLSTYGVVPRGKYGDIDLTNYDGQRARQWGRSGVPDALEPIARQHPVTAITLVDTYEAARDAIAGGHPVSVCSNQGFAMTRDSSGFCRPQGRWGHCMCFVGTVGDSRRPGLICFNSWGDYLQGSPRGPLEIPDGGFAVDADVAHRMLQAGDSFAFAGLKGWSPIAPDFTLA